MATVLQGDVKVPGLGKTKKVWIYGGLGVAGAYVGWRWYQASRATGETDDGTYSSTDQSELGRTTTGGAYNPGGNTGNTDTDGTTPDAIDTNAEWTNKAVELLSNAGYDPAAVAAALGEFLDRRALDKTEATIARAAVAMVGQPPVGRPWSVLEESGTGTGTLPAPGGVKAVATSWNTVVVSWNSVPGAASYQVFRNGSAIGTSVTTSFTLSGLAAKTTYRFAVAAVGSTGKTGAKSGESSVTTPAAPTTTLPGKVPAKPGKPKIPPYTEVVARRGDSVSKIAARYGKSWQTVWNFNLQYRNPATAALMKTRGPNKIFAGTRVWVPR